ncbi:hypothetical protein ACERII_21775 [Evansella sp. AB-rgal1]|uniref:hypothetical protein n=1 Tax=Evansella sp. AB-rgal1 TaxID=3242696 RepID=UPI00359D6A0E
MFRDLKEDSFEQLKDVAYDRTHPGNIIVFLWGALVISSVIFAFTFLGSGSDNVSSPIWEDVLTVSRILLIIQFICTLLFSLPKIAYSFQRIQILFVCIVSLKVSLEFYLGFFLLRADRNLPENMDQWGLFAILGGIVILVLSIIRALARVRKGHFTLGGKGLYHFQQSKGYVSLPIIFTASVFGGIFGRIHFETATGQLFEVLMFLLLAIVIQYIIAMVWPEFLLISYCKFRFSSFIVQEESKSHRGHRKKKKETEPLSFWVLKPISVIKSRAGLLRGEKAPFTALVIVWIQGSTVFFLILLLLYLRNAARGVIEVTLVEDMISYLVVGSVFSFITVLILRIFFTFVTKMKAIR